MNRTVITRIVNILFLIALLTPLVIKAVYVDNFIYRFTGSRMLGATQVIANDAPIYIGILLLFYLSFLTNMFHIISIIMRIVAFSIFGLYMADYIIITNFNSHLLVSDTIKYASYSHKYIQQLYSGKGLLVILVAMIAIGLAATITFTRFKIKNKLIHRLSVFTILTLLLTSCFRNNDMYVHSWAYRNFLDYNLTALSEANAYSDNFIDNFSFNDKKQCYSKPSKTPNIILLMVESLSAYQSKFFSGIRDWTPNLDLIAHNNISYHNFYANGFTTEDGEIALLTGLFPIYPPSNFTNGGSISFKGFFNINDSLPNILQKQGYATEFITTADLNFSNTGNWASSIGFEYIEGNEHPYYENWNRFHFDAAPDEALYDRVLDRINHNHNNKYFLFIKTVSSHHPFINPDNRNRSEAEVFQYADKQIGSFYKNLTDLGFFENGILIIVGDHHSMIPLKKEEIEKFGPLKAASKIPLIISWGDKHQSIRHEQYQQVDIFNSLKYLTSNTQCYSNWVGDVLNFKPAKYIAYKRGDHRDRISIFSGDKDFLIKLNGDHTRMIGNYSVDKATQDLMVKKVNSVRISRNQKNPRLLQSLTQTK